MKRIYIILIISFLFISSVFSQEEIWGYQSFGGEIGGGLVFKLDIENEEATTVHSFGYSTGYHGYTTDNPLVDGGNGLLYTIAYIKQSPNIYGYNTFLISYHPESKEIEILEYVDENIQIVYSDHENQILYLFKEFSSGSGIWKYDIENNEYTFLLFIDFDYGKTLTGSWIKIEGMFYFFMQFRGTYTEGTCLEYDPLSNTISTIFDFNEIKYPQGSLLAHDNGFYYGVAKRGGESNKGSIFKIDPRGGGYDILIEFNDEIGSPPMGESILANDGCVYGMTSAQGELGKGSIYKYNPENNELSAIYYFDPESDFMVNHQREYKLTYDEDHKIYFYTTPYESSISEKAFLMCFDLETFEMETIIDYRETNINSPNHKLTRYDNTYFSLGMDDGSQYTSGVYTIDLESSQIENQTNLVSENLEENGQNPIWLIQGADGDVYGMTHYGGAEDKGVLFSIDKNTEDYSKLMDLNELGDVITIWSEAFLLENGNILGFYTDKNEGNYHRKIFMFNPVNLEFETIFEFSVEAIPRNDIRMNSEGNLYYVAYDGGLFNMFEYHIKKDSLFLVDIMPDSSIRSIYEWNDQIYYGTTPESIFKWNKTIDSIEFIFELKELGDYGIGSFRDDIFVTKDEQIYSAYTEYESKPSWLTSFHYNIPKDSVMNNSELGRNFEDNFYKAYLEQDWSNYLILGIFNRDNEIKVFDKKNNNVVEIALEKSPYYIDYYYDPWGDWEIDGGDRPFNVIPRIGLAKVLPKDRKSYWLGTEDSVWINENNWFHKKLPSENDEIAISKYSKNFPYLDTLIEIVDLELESNAQLTISPKGDLTCASLYNNGKIKMQAIPDEKASFIIKETTELGKLEYSYMPKIAEEKILTMPVREANTSFVDSINVWEYQNNNWFLVEDINQVFNFRQLYKYELDSLETITFSGDANAGRVLNSFHKKGLLPLLNPYAASLKWDRLDLDNLSHKAFYRFHEKDSTFSAWVDGLGDGSPLIQPLQAIWVYSEIDEHIELNDYDRVHARDFSGNELELFNNLILKVDGKSGEDLTYISFNQAATANFDKEYDAFKFMYPNSQGPFIFTSANDELASINQLPDTSMMDLFVTSNEDGRYNVSIPSQTGFDFVVLEDLVWNKRIDLLQQDYSFDYFTSDGDYPFKLYFNQWALEPVAEADIDIYYYPESIVVRSQKQIEYASITFYDLAGRVALQFDLEDFHYYETPISLPVGHYIVQLRSGDLVVNRKILVRR